MILSLESYYRAADAQKQNQGGRNEGASLAQEMSFNKTRLPKQSVQCALDHQKHASNHTLQNTAKSQLQQKIKTAD
jgi:hypothetical protein